MTKVLVKFRWGGGEASNAFGVGQVCDNKCVGLHVAGPNTCAGRVDAANGESTQQTVEIDTPERSLRLSL